MPITFVDAAEVSVGAICTVIYGAPGVGKTSLGLTADRPVLLDFDLGVQRAVGREGKAAVRVSRWADIEGLQRADLDGYSTVVVDTVGRCLDRLSEDIIARNAKHGSGGALTLQGYGQLKSRFAQWLRAIQGYGLDVVLIAHATEEQRGDDTVDRLDAAGSSKNLVYQTADVMGRLLATQDGVVLDCAPSAGGFGKSPGLPAYRIQAGGTDTLARIIAEAKSAMSAQNAASEAESAAWQERLVVWRAMLDDVGQVNAEVAALADAPREEKRAFADLVKGAGYVWHRDAGGYARQEAV